MAKDYTIVLYSDGRYKGVREASEGVGVSKSQIYKFLKGDPWAVSKERRKRIRVVDMRVFVKRHMPK